MFAVVKREFSLRDLKRTLKDSAAKTAEKIFAKGGSLYVLEDGVIVKVDAAGSRQIVKTVAEGTETKSRRE